MHISFAKMSLTASFTPTTDTRKGSIAMAFYRSDISMLGAGGWYSLMTRNTRQKFSRRWQFAESISRTVICLPSTVSNQVSKPASRCQMIAKSTSMPRHHQQCQISVRLAKWSKWTKGEAGIQWLAAVLHCSKSRLQYLWMEWQLSLEFEPVTAEQTYHSQADRLQPN